MSLRLANEELQTLNLKGAHILSLYLQIDPAKGSLRNQFDVFFDQKLYAIEHGFEEAEELREFISCVQRVRQFLMKCEARERTLVIFCGGAGVLWFRQLNMTMANDIRWQETPHVGPLIDALQANEAYAVVLTGPSDSRLFSITGNKIHEHAKIDRKSVEEDAAYLKRVIAATEELMRSENPRRLILGGFPDIAAQMTRLASPAFRKSVASTVGLPMTVTPEQVLEATRPLDLNALHRFEMHEVDDMINRAINDKDATFGLRGTLDALNHGKVWQLVYSKKWAGRGGHCDVCGALYADELQLCPECNVSVRISDDLLDEMISKALSADASIEEVDGFAAARLDRVGGVGAFLR